LSGFFKKMKRVFVIVLLVAIVTALPSSLHVELKSTWIDTPKIAEIGEFLSHRTNESLYWTFMERIGDIKDDIGLDVAREILDDGTFSLLKMALDLRFIISFKYSHI
jgi:hypothetical protein